MLAAIVEVQFVGGDEVKVYPIGYSRYGAQERIDELTKQSNILIMDTRLKPYSWRTDYRQAELKAKYGNTYHWCGKHLGNINYQGGPIKLANPSVGIDGLTGYLKAGYDLILLCQCTSFADCHMQEICRLLMEKMPEVEVVKFNSQVQTDTIPCFSTRPPYGSWLANPQRFIDIGLPPKTIENRDQDFTGGYRGPIFIHQSKTFEEDAIEYWYGCMPGIEEIFSLEEEGYPHGCIIGQAEIVDVIEDSENPWFCGEYGIVLENARPIDPLPYRGQLGLFSVDRSVLAKFEPMKDQEPERIIICQRSGQGKGCMMTWTAGDKVTCSIPYSGDVHGIVRGTKMEGLSQKVQLRTAVYAPLLSKYIVSNDKRWFDGSSLKPRGTIIPELGEHEE